MSSGLLARRRQKEETIPMSAEETHTLMCANFEEDEEDFFDRTIEGKVFRHYGEFILPNRFKLDRKEAATQLPEKPRKKAKYHSW